jgi:molecular chaperone DnaK
LRQCRHGGTAVALPSFREPAQNAAKIKNVAHAWELGGSVHPGHNGTSRPGQSPPWALSVDFGTCFTAAATAPCPQQGASAAGSAGGAREGSAPPVMLETDGGRLLPSAVALDEDGGFLTGRAALQRALNRPELTERAPKRALVRQDGRVLLGTAEHPATALVAAVLRRVRQAAVAAHGGDGPARTVLTHPALWNAADLARLGEAAALAGLDAPRFLPEPVAAALHHAAGAGLPEGACLAVYDLGGGTLDTAVLRRTADGFDTVAVGGEPHFGGEDLDECLAGLLARRAADRDPAPWRDLWSSGAPERVAQRALLRREITAARETLSTAGSVDLAVPGYRDTFLVRSHEYRTAVTPALTRSYDVLAATVREAGLEPDDLHAVVLTGGASRTPLVSDLIAERLRRLPLLTADPKASVVLGALGALTAGPTAGPTPGRAGSLVPVGAAPAPAVRPRRYYRPDGDPEFEFRLSGRPPHAPF